FNGTHLPFLTRYASASKTFTYRPFPGWGVRDSPNFGGIAAFENFVFVVGMGAYTGDFTGLIRIDTSTNAWLRFGGYVDYIDINMGLDGKLYGLVLPEDGFPAEIQVFDPRTTAFLRSISIPPRSEEHTSELQSR